MLNNDNINLNNYITIKGPTGPTGPTGSIGLIGSTGPTGMTGPARQMEPYKYNNISCDPIETKYIIPNGIDYFSYKGDYNTGISNVIDKITQLCDTKNVQLTSQKLTDYMCEILRGNYSKVNLLLFDNLIDKNTNKNLINDIFTAYMTTSRELTVRIETEIKTASGFLDMYKKYLGTSFMFLRCISRYNLSRLEIADIGTDRKSKMNFVSAIRNTVLFHVLMQHKFAHGTKYLYELIDDTIMCVSTSEKIDIINIFDFYDRFASRYYKNRNNITECLKYQNNESFRKIVDDVLLNIDDLFERSKKEEDIKRMISLCNKIISDKNELAIKYMQFMSKRLLARTSDLNEEYNACRLLFPNKYNELYIRMMYQIKDLSRTCIYEDQYRKTNVSFTSDKYKKIGENPHVLTKRKNTNFTAMCSYAWNAPNIDDCKYEMPEEISVYTMIYNKVFSENNPEKTLTYDYENSTGVLQMTLLGGRQYCIQMNILQMAAIIYISKHHMLSALSLAEKLNAPLLVVGNILNSLKHDELIRISNDFGINNPETVFAINWECLFVPGENVSLVNTYNKFVKFSKLDKKEREILISVSKDINSVLDSSMLKVHILTTMSEILVSDKANLQKELSKKNIIVPIRLLEAEINKCCEQGKLLMQKNMITYRVVNNDIVVDSDTEDS